MAAYSHENPQNSDHTSSAEATQTEFAQEASPGAAPSRPLSGIDPRKLNPAQVLQLQRNYGNQAVMRLLAQRKAALSQPPTAPNPAPAEGQVARKMLEWPNPVLQNAGITQPTEGKSETEAAAKALSDEVDRAAEHINFMVFSYNEGLVAAEDVLGYLEGYVDTYHVDNFVNKLIDWQASGTGKKLSLLKSAAGYVIEGFADKVAKNLGLGIQYVSGGARPDYRVQTKKTFDFNGTTLDADGLIDSTSEAEALQGHITGKVTKMNPADAQSHPHLFDVYYEDLGIGAATKLPVNQSGLAKDRADYHAKKIGEAQARRGSLRSYSGSKIKEGKKPGFKPY